jgi:hypothetical protein
LPGFRQGPLQRNGDPHIWIAGASREQSGHSRTRDVGASRLDNVSRSA